MNPKDPKPNDPREYPSRESWALHSAEAQDRRRKVRAGRRIALLIVLGLVLAASVARCHGDEIRVKDTGSMRGWLTPGGAWLQIDRTVKVSDLRKGQVIVYRHSKAGLVCHRIIEIHQGRVWTKGDSNRTPDDEWVTASNLVGVIRP